MSESSKPSRNVWLIAGAATVILFLCVGMVTAGFIVGRLTATPEPVSETTTRMIEATTAPPVIIDTQTADAGSETAERVEADATVETTETAETAEPVATGEETTPPTDVPKPPATTQARIEELNFDIFYEAWRIIEQEFDGNLPSNEELLQAAINGSIESLNDPFTRYVRPEVAARLREDMGGSVEGIGAFVRENEEGFIEIVRPISGQPAELAGLRPGDIIVGVDGASVLGETLDEVLLKVRGPRGTTVTLTIMRPEVEEPLEFSIVRTRFEIPIIESQMLPDNIAYVRLTEFNRNASERLQAALETLLAQEPRAVIFDLRDNPGGFLDQSIAVADIFLPDGVVLFERNAQGLDQMFRADNGDMAESIPLVVLINAGSASAAEIVAGAIQDNGRAILIGEVSFGKGSVQQVHQLSDGSELRVTIARWYTPANNTIDGQGIIPDIEVESPLDFTLGGEGDTQLERAVEYILTGE
jgi:carboxyl-terminal processing protease